MICIIRIQPCYIRIHSRSLRPPIQYQHQHQHRRHRVACTQKLNGRALKNFGLGEISTVCTVACSMQHLHLSSCQKEEIKNEVNSPFERLAGWLAVCIYQHQHQLDTHKIDFSFTKFDPQ